MTVEYRIVIDYIDNNGKTISDDGKVYKTAEERDEIYKTICVKCEDHKVPIVKHDIEVSTWNYYKELRKNETTLYLSSSCFRKEAIPEILAILKNT